MKVYIKSEGVRFFILLPTALFLNRLTANLAAKELKRKYPSMEIVSSDFIKLFDALKQCKKKYGRMELINIVTANGETVYISL